MELRRELPTRIWNLLILLAATAAAIEIPFRLVVAVPANDPLAIGDWLITLIFIADLILRLRGVDAAGEGSVIRTFDLLAALPIQILGPLNPFHLVRLSKLFRVGLGMRRWRQRTIGNASGLRLLFFVYWLGLSAHWIACGWLALRGVDPAKGIGENYIRALYWCVETLTTVGYGDITPANVPETIYAILVMLVGIGIYGFIIGNVASLLSNIDPVRTKYLEEMEGVNAFMRYRGIPATMQRRVRDHYAYLWEKRMGYDEEAFLQRLPASLAAEISLHLKREVIDRVPLFHGASDAFVREVALRLRPMVFLPGDVIVRAGERGKEMYFISRGEAEARGMDGTILRRMSDGDFFGEIALVLGQVRTASVHALTHCDLYVLDRKTYERITDHYPDVADQIRERASERAANDGVMESGLLEPEPPLPDEGHGDASNEKSTGDSEHDSMGGE